MARHPSDRWRLVRGAVHFARREPLATLVLILVVAANAALLVQLLHDAGWLPVWAADLQPLRPGIWR